MTTSPLIGFPGHNPPNNFVVMIASGDFSQEIFAIYILKVLRLFGTWSLTCSGICYDYMETRIKDEEHLFSSVIHWNDSLES